MRAFIGTELVRKLPNQDLDIRDTKLKGFVLRCRASGRHSYRVQLGRGRWFTIGPIDVWTPSSARDEARNKLAESWKGQDPIAARKAAKTSLTLRAFVKDHYEPWALEHQKRGKETVQRVRSVFDDLLELKLSELTTWTVEKWRTGRLKRRRKPKPSTVNSQVTLLKAVLTKAVAWKILTVHPLREIKLLKADRTGRMRHLSADEERRLRAALTARDERRKDRREQANAWRRERGYPEWPVDHTDHLTPIVLLALNTGLRKGEVFNLKWSDVDRAHEQLTIRGEGAKTGQTRYVPLNSEAVTVLSTWQKVTTNHDGYVFPGRVDGTGRLEDVKKAWLPVIRATKIEHFRFHDLRHTFASKLVTAAHARLTQGRPSRGSLDSRVTIGLFCLAARLRRKTAT